MVISHCPGHQFPNPAHSAPMRLAMPQSGAHCPIRLSIAPMRFAMPAAAHTFFRHPRAGGDPASNHRAYRENGGTRFPRAGPAAAGTSSPAPVRHRRLGARQRYNEAGATRRCRGNGRDEPIPGEPAWRSGLALKSPSADRISDRLSGHIGRDRHGEHGGSVRQPHSRRSRPHRRATVSNHRFGR